MVIKSAGQVVKAEPVGVDSSYVQRRCREASRCGLHLRFIIEANKYYFSGLIWTSKCVCQGTLVQMWFKLMRTVLVVPIGIQKVTFSPL